MHAFWKLECVIVDDARETFLESEQWGNSGLSAFLTIPLRRFIGAWPAQQMMLKRETHDVNSNRLGLIQQKDDLSMAMLTQNERLFASPGVMLSEDPIIAPIMVFAFSLPGGVPVEDACGNIDIKGHWGNTKIIPGCERSLFLAVTAIVAIT
jgi:hypothetical protein